MRIDRGLASRNLTESRPRVLRPTDGAAFGFSANQAPTTENIVQEYSKTGRIRYLDVNGRRAGLIRKKHLRCFPSTALSEMPTVVFRLPRLCPSALVYDDRVTSLPAAGSPLRRRGALMATLFAAQVCASTG